jgi:hypothetical protein
MPEGGMEIDSLESVWQWNGDYWCFWKKQQKKKNGNRVE